MSLVIELPRPVERRLEDEAAKAGVSKTEYAAELLTKNLPDGEIAPEDNARTLPDLTAFWQKVENAPLDPPNRPLTAFERGIREKFRKQGFNVSYRETDATTEE